MSKRGKVSNHRTEHRNKSTIETFTAAITNQTLTVATAYPPTTRYAWGSEKICLYVILNLLSILSSETLDYY